MCETLIVMCDVCKNSITTFKTSKKVKDTDMIVINLRSVMAATSVGGGLTTLRRLYTDFNFPQPVNEHPYNKYLKYLGKTSIENVEQSMSKAAKHLRNITLKKDDDDGT